MTSADKPWEDDQASALDAEALDALRDLLGGDAESLAEVIDEFLDSAPNLIADLRSGVACGDVELTARAAHTLKANGATFGAVALAERCRNLEAVARSGSSAGELDAVDAIEDEWSRVRAHLCALRPAGAA